MQINYIISDRIINSCIPWDSSYINKQLIILLRTVRINSLLQVQITITAPELKTKPIPSAAVERPWNVKAERKEFITVNYEDSRAFLFAFKLK